MDASATLGAEEALRRFGSADEIAASFDAEVAARRVLPASVGSVIGVLATGASVLALLNGDAPGTSAVAPWAVSFFACAQVAALCSLLVVLHAAALRRRSAASANVALLCRCGLLALLFADGALFAAAAAVPGEAPAWVLLSGPVVGLGCMVWLLRVRALARRLDTVAGGRLHAPLADLRTLIRGAHSPTPIDDEVSSVGLLFPTVVVATITAFWWDLSDQGTVHSACAAAGTEGALTVLAFIVLGPALGLWSHTQARSQDLPSSP